MVPVFNSNESDLKIGARKLDEETEEEKGRYVMPFSTPHVSPRAHQLS